MLNELDDANKLVEINLNETKFNKQIQNVLKFKKSKHWAYYSKINRYKKCHLYKDQFFKRKCKIKRFEMNESISSRYSTNRMSTNSFNELNMNRLNKRSTIKNEIKFRSIYRSIDKSTNENLLNIKSSIKNSIRIKSELNSDKSIKKHLSINQHPPSSNVIRVSNAISKQQFTVRCLLFYFIQLLIGTLLILNKVLASDTCLDHCNCIYSKNKFQVDCSALALDSLPVVSIFQLIFFVVVVETFNFKLIFRT